MNEEQKDPVFVCFVPTPPNESQFINGYRIHGRAMATDGTWWMALANSLWVKDNPPKFIHHQKDLLQ